MFIRKSYLLNASKWKIECEGAESACPPFSNTSSRVLLSHTQYKNIHLSDALALDTEGRHYLEIFLVYASQSLMEFGQVLCRSVVQTLKKEIAGRNNGFFDTFYG